MKKLFTGVCTALVTPFMNGEVDFQSLGRLIERQIEGGVCALLILGTTGEAASLTESEREAVIRFTLEIVAGRLPVIVGVSGNNLDKVLGMVREAKRLGADAVLVTAPYYIRGTQDGIIQWFSQIGRIGVPIIVYNIPGRTGVNIEPSTLATICKVKSIIGIKESSGNLEQIAQVLKRVRIPVYAGDDALSLPSYALGALGVVSVASNARPSEVSSLWNAHKAGSSKRAAKLYLEQLDFYNSLFTTVNPVPIKKVLSDLGHCQNEVRLPLTSLI